MCQPCVFFSSRFQRALCCFPGFANPVAAARKGKLPKPLLAGVSGTTPSIAGCNGGAQFVQGEILLLEKQGRSSQQQRMPDANNHANTGGVNPNNLPPSSLPRPPRPKTNSSHSSQSHRRLGEYNRLPEAELTPARKKSDAGQSLSSQASSRNASPARSLIPPPRKLGEYGRLSESGASSVSLRKPAARARSGDRDSASTFSDNSASSLPHPSKVRFYSAPRRSSSLARDSKSSTDSTSSNKFRIQF